MSATAGGQAQADRRQAAAEREISICRADIEARCDALGFQAAYHQTHQWMVSGYHPSRSLTDDLGCDLYIGPIKFIHQGFNLPGEISKHSGFFRS